MAHSRSPDAPVAPASRVRGIRYAVRDVVVLADELRRSGKKMYYLNIGDPNMYGFAPPDALVEAAVEAMRANRNGYAPSDGIEEAREAIVEDAANRGIDSIVYNWVGSGLSEVIDMALTALVEPDDNVLIPSPGYPLYSALLTKLGAEGRSYQLSEADGWQPDLADIEARIDDRTRAIVVINPNNPTGSVASEKTLRGILELAVANNLVVFADEIYDRLVFDGARHVPLGSLDPRASVLTLNGLSKNWIVPGFRIGWGVLSGIEEKLAGYVGGIQQLGRARLCANHPEQYGIAPALRGSQEHIGHLNREMMKRRDVAMERLNAVDGISCVEPQGAFYAFARLPDGVDDGAWSRELMRETGVVVVPGNGFGQAEGTAHFRIVLLPSLEVLGEACDLIGRFVGNRTGSAASE